MKAQTTFAASLAMVLVAACTNAPVRPPAAAHLRAESAQPAPASQIPQPVQQSAALPPPKATPKAETYSVVVKDVRVQELLFALARDAKLNVDIHPGIAGTVTLNAIDQTLPQLLNRIAQQTDMRFELHGPNLVVMPDKPFLRTYKIDYINMSRETAGNVAINTQIASTSSSAGAGTTTSATAGSGNISSTKVDNVTKNRFWETLEKNIKDLLNETDKEIVVSRRTSAAQEEAGRQAESATAARNDAAQAGASAATPARRDDTAGRADRDLARRSSDQDFKDYKTLLAASVIANPESGLISIRATARQHEKVQEFLDRVMSSAKRQVLIEATIAEVRLAENYQQGIDWQYLRSTETTRAGGQGATTQSIDPITGAFTTQTATLPSAVSNTLFTLAFRRGGFTAAMKLIESFGTLKVLSSPKISVLNNQTALLKVVDNIVYFEVKANTTSATGGSPALTNITTTPQSVSVGLVMSVTPQIGDDKSILLNVRPTISRVTGFKSDPNPFITIPNLVPEIQTREMESLMSVNDGDIAVLGGLMQDVIENTDDAVPGLSKLQLFGNLFAHRNDKTTRTELVIFLRTTIIKDPSVYGTYVSFRDQLPGEDFFGNNPGPQQQSIGAEGAKR